MTTVFTPPPAPAPPPDAGFPDSSVDGERSLLGILASVLIGAAMLWGLLLLTASVFIVAGGPSVEVIGLNDEFVETGTEATPADAYFGRVELAPGSSVELSVGNVWTVDDIVVLESSPGLNAEIFDQQGEGVMLSLLVDDGVEPGIRTVVFDVSGEARPIELDVVVLPR